MWYTREAQCEGSPLFLRFPSKPDFDSLQKKYPQFLLVTHTFDKITSSGMPEADYNDTLANFDHEMMAAFEPSAGTTVLVETFNGRRIYYSYISADASLEEVKERFSQKYPEHQLTWDPRDDPEWAFIRRYAAEYEFY
jgi:hypothetical protein